MSKIDGAIWYAVLVAFDNSHGYDQDNRWGPDFDCSSLIIQSWEEAGVPVKSSGASYTGNMKRVFLNNGFIDVTNKINLKNGNGLVKGDVLLNELHHTAMALDNNQIVHASINEKGKARGGITGDQTGKEIYIRNYYNYPWDCVLRYVGESGSVYPEPTRTLRKGSSGIDVKWVQEKINNYINSFNGNSNDLLEIDGIFGSLTDNRVKAFQWLNGIEIDGIVGINTRNVMKLY